MALLRLPALLLSLTMAAGSGAGLRGDLLRADAPAAPPPPCTVQLEGDSILHGGTSASERIPEPPAQVLQRLRPAYAILDRSANGMSAFLRMPFFIGETIDARIVVIEFGVNDAGLSSPYEASMRVLIEHARAQGATVVLTGLPRQRSPLRNRDAYDAIARRLAAEYGLAFADWGAVRFDASEMYDEVHPLQPYSTRLVEQLARTLDRVAPECAALE